MGSGGNGTFTQAGGTNNLGGGALWLGLASIAGGGYGEGTYYLGGSGLLSAYSENVGIGGPGTIIQSGGTNSIQCGGPDWTGGGGAAGLCLGYGTGPGGNYSLGGSGLLSAFAEYVGDFGTGTFAQSGGTNNVGVGGLYVGYWSGSRGNYILSGGQLWASQENVSFNGTGTFTQSGGTNMVTGAFSLGEAGTYNLTGGALLVPGIQGTGVFNLGGGTLIASTGFSTSQAMTLSGSGGNGNINTGGYTIILSGQLSGPGGLNLSGGGNLTLTAPAIIAAPRPSTAARSRWARGAHW